ncbi:MAG TPA: glycosyltransferase [Acidisphaera sp.]|nr:glycosyltransferase [Acidisphaera sp.]
MKFLVCTGHPLESQANAQVRRSVMDGLEACFGEGSATAANISGASGVVGALQPDFVLGLGSYLPESTYFGEVAREARRVGARMVFWATEEPYEQDASYRIERDFDAIFSCDRWGVNFHRHKHAYHLPLAGCGVRHVRPYDEAAERPIDVMFCGVAFSSRKELIEELRPSLAGLNISFIGPGWGQFGFGFSDRRIEKDQLIDLYGQSKIVLNLGRSLHFENQRYMIVPSSPGPRTYEAALAGALQLFHEDTYEIRRYFTADEMPTFSNKREFDTLLTRYLGSPALRHATARRAQQRALAEHTYAHRMQAMVQTLKAQALL